MQDLGRNMYFMSIDKAKFRKTARPGDMLEYHVDKLAQPQHVVVPGRGEGRRRPDRRGRTQRLLGQGINGRDDADSIARARRVA